MTSDQFSPRSLWSFSLSIVNIHFSPVLAHLVLEMIKKMTKSCSCLENLCKYHHKSYNATPKLLMSLVYIFVTDDMGLASVNLL